MTDQVIMPGTDYQAICNAVRALTGGTDTLKSGDIASALGAVRKLTVQTGTFTPASNQSLITIPATGKPDVLIVETDDTTPLTGSLFAVIVADIVRHEGAADTIRNACVNVMQPSGAIGAFSTIAQISDVGVTIEMSSTRVFAAGREYRWTAYRWEAQ